MLSLRRDIVYTIRLWRRNAGSTLAAFAALSIGIAGTTAIFGVISALLLQPLPVSDPATLVSIFTTDKHHSQSLISMPDAIDLKHRLNSASGVAIYSEQLFNLSADNKTLLVHALTVDPALFAVLGIRPIEGTASAVVLSWQFWQAQFAGRPVIGQQIRLDDRVLVVSGILPKGLDLPSPSDLWVPLEFDLTKPENKRAIHYYYAIARLRPGIPDAQLRAELSVLSSQFAAENSAENAGVVFKSISLRDAIAGDAKTPLLLLLTAVAGVLLMACANVANLLLARSSARLREISVRIAVGASRLHLFRQLMTESLLLAAVSAAAGSVLAALALHIIKGLPDTQIPRPEFISLDWRVLLFAVCTTVLTAMLFGVLPALNASRCPVTEVLKQAGSRTTDSLRSQFLRRILLASETAIATMLLISSVLLVESFRHLAQADPGFETDHLLTLYLSLPTSRYGGDSVNAARFAGKVLPLVEALPGVRHAAITKNLPLDPGGNGPIQIEGLPAPANLREQPSIIREEITPSYRGTLDIPLLRGRDFDQRENIPGATAVLLNQAAAKLYFSEQNPIGQRVAYRFDLKDPNLVWHEVVGVIGDTRREASRVARPAVFIPMVRAASPYPAVVVRTAGDPASYARAVEDAVHKVDPDVPCFLVSTMDQLLKQQLGWRAFDTSLLTVFTAIALLLAGVGILSVVAYSVSQRTSEIGLRIACGASQSNILILILLQGVGPAAAGITLGVVASLPLGRYLEGLLSGVNLHNPTPYILSALFLLFVATAASFLPARRAASIDPWIALRYE